MKKILATDPRPMYFWGNDNDNKQFIGWEFRDASNNKIGIIADIWYDPNDVYNSTDGHGGTAYKMSISYAHGYTGEEIIEFRHINDVAVFKKLKAFQLCRPPSPPPTI